MIMIALLNVTFVTTEFTLIAIILIALNINVFKIPMICGI